MTTYQACAKHLRFPISFLAVLFISGCSSFSGQKLGIDKSTSKQIAPTGLPYSLTRPEFKMSRAAPTEGEKTPTYTVAVSYEPDPSQQYDIKISPSFFADGTLTVKFTTAGGVSSTNAGITDLIGPTITALGSFAKDVISASGVFDQNVVRAMVINAMTTDTRTDQIAECMVQSVVPIPPEPHAANEKTIVSVRTVGKEMATRIQKFSSDDEFVEKFHYITAAEKQCLVKVAQAVIKVKDQELKTDIQNWKTEEIKYKIAQPTDEEFIARITKAYDDKDLSEIINIGTDNKTAFKNGNVSEKALAQARLPVIAAVETAMRSNAQSELPKKLEAIYSLSPSAWLARHVLYLEREVTRLELARIQRPDISSASSTEISKYIEQLQFNRARALGVLDLHERARTLTNFLRQIERKTERGGTAPATAEYAVARQELDNVLSQIDGRRTKIVAAASPLPAPTLTAIKDQPIPSVDETVITGSKASGWAASEAGKNAPPFVLFLREVK